MKILYTTDLHGNTSHYDKLFEVAVIEKADIVINGGDMLPKEQDLFQQDRFITGYLEEHFKKFQEAKIPYLCQLGNDDLSVFDDLFQVSCDGYSLVHNVAQKKVEINGYEFIGMNWVVDYPFRLKDRCRMDTKEHVFCTQHGSGLLSCKLHNIPTWYTIPDWWLFVNSLSTIEQELKKLPVPKDMSKTIYIMHMPPSGLGLDVCFDGRRVGSNAILKFIQDKQPLASLHGHIHESSAVSGVWNEKVGKTLVVQPGQKNNDFICKTFLT